MSEFEEALKQALARHEPSPNFTERILARVEAQTSPMLREQNQPPQARNLSSRFRSYWTRCLSRIAAVFHRSAKGATQRVPPRR
jgi:hypothetical protein